MKIITKLPTAGSVFPNRNLGTWLGGMKRLGVLTILGLAACGGGGDSVAPPPPPVPTSIQLAAQGSTAIAAGGSAQFSAIVLDQRGAPMAGRPITFVSSAAIGTISANGLFTSTGPVGSTNITATSGTLSSMAVVITVNAGAPAALAKVTGDNQAGVVATQLPTALSVRVSDAHGNPVAGATIPWVIAQGQASLSAPTSTTGADGTASATLTLGTVAAAISVVATLNPSVSVTFAEVSTHGPPATISKFDGDQQTAFIETTLPLSPRVLVRDQYGNPAAAAVTFVAETGSGTVSSATVSTDAYGVAGTTWTLGSRMIPNSLRASTAGMPSVVFTAQAESPYSITIRYLTPFSGAHESEIAAAVARWRRALLTNLGSFQLSFPPDHCFVGQPALNEVHRNLLIYVRIQSIDGPGNTLANARTCYVDQATDLPVMSIVNVDIADIASLDADGIFGAVLSHEIGHAVGFSGSLFVQGNLTAGTTADPYFVGSNARSEFARRIPSYAGTPVPLENTGGAGTAGSHWRATVFGDEMMVGFIAPGAIGSLSSVTIGAMQDLGYRVDLLSGEAFGAVARSTMSGTRMIDLGNDMVPIAPRPIRAIRP